MKPTVKLLASSPDTVGILRMVKNYFCSNNATIELTTPGLYKIINLKGDIEGFRVIRVKGRYRFEAVQA